MTSVPDQDPTHKLRWGIYLLLIALSSGHMIGRILAVNSVDMASLEKVRFRDVKKALAARVERYRKKLVDTHIEGDELEHQVEAFRQKQAELEPDLLRKKQLQRPFLSGNDRSRWCMIRALVEDNTYEIDRVVNRTRWDTIDMVKHEGDDGEPHLYSSKPTLLPTLMAAEYWLIYNLTPLEFETHEYEIVRIMLIVTNVIPMILFFVLLAKLVERYAESDWARIFVMATATFGTFLTTFAIVLNNHLPAALCVLATLYCCMRIWHDGQRQWWYFALAGFFAAFSVACELPALSLFAATVLALVVRDKWHTLIAFAPAAVLVFGGFFSTNYIAHGSMRPPYMHRSEIEEKDNWYYYHYQRGGKTRDSYWMNRQGIDKGEASRSDYAMHVLIGHHGIFSLTPVWILSFIGMGIMAFNRRLNRQSLALLIGSISLVCIGFYLARPQVDRNYGGTTSAFRWLFWLAPMWLIAMIPLLDAIRDRRGLKIAAAVLLCISAVSVAYPIWNPWTHPWLLQFMIHMDWWTLPA